MSAERPPSPHQTLTILIIGLNGESTLLTRPLILNGRSYRRGEASSQPPLSTTVSAISPHIFPVSLPNPVHTHTNINTHIYINTFKHMRTYIYIHTCSGRRSLATGCLEVAWSDGLEVYMGSLPPRFILMLSLVYNGYIS